mgnify:CR=1 FL=1
MLHALQVNLRGPDVAQLINLLYVNKWQKLGIGKVRYGVMCAEDGVVMDDGVTGRLGGKSVHPDLQVLEATAYRRVSVYRPLIAVGRQAPADRLPEPLATRETAPRTRRLPRAASSHRSRSRRRGPAGCGSPR